MIKLLAVFFNIFTAFSVSYFEVSMKTLLCYFMSHPFVLVQLNARSSLSTCFVRHTISKRLPINR